MESRNRNQSIVVQYCGTDLCINQKGNGLYYKNFVFPTPISYTYIALFFSKSFSTSVRGPDDTSPCSFRKGYQYHCNYNSYPYIHTRMSDDQRTVWKGMSLPMHQYTITVQYLKTFLCIDDCTQLGSNQDMWHWFQRLECGNH